MILTVKPAELEEVADLLAATFKHDASAGSQGLSDMVDGSLLFKLVNDAGESVGAYALRISQHEKQTVAWVVGASGRLPGVDLLATVWPVIKEQARACGASQVAFITRRQGMIRQMKKQGFAVTGVVMRGAV